MKYILLYISMHSSQEYAPQLTHRLEISLKAEFPDFYFYSNSYRWAITMQKQINLSNTKYILQLENQDANHTLSAKNKKKSHLNLIFLRGLSLVYHAVYMFSANYK